MATLASLPVPVLMVLMVSVGQGVARSTLDIGDRHHILPYLRESGVYDYQHGVRLGGKQSHYPQAISTEVEPSSRDLDIGFTVGGDDDVEHLDTSVEPIRSGYVARESYRGDQPPDDVNIGVFADPPPSKYASSGWTEDGHEVIVLDEERNQWRRNWARDDGMRRGAGARVYPGVIAQPLDYKVGELKLRNDRGYQLSMHVPPSSVGDRPGVLKIDMKATLYRPIYY